MSTTTVTCKPCGASASFTGETSWKDMVVWDKGHRLVCPGDVQSPMSRRRDLNTEVAGNAGESTVGGAS